MIKHFHIPIVKIARLITAIFILSTSQSIAADTLTVAGIKGLLFQEKDSDYKISITTSFKLHEITVLPQDVNLDYTASNKSFKMHDKVKILLGNDSILVTLGDSLNPGIIISNKILENINLSISNIFKLKEVSITPKNLTIVWNKGTYKYIMFGLIEITIDNQKTTALLGTQANPGIEIDSGNVKHINIGVSGSLSLRSLTIKPRALTVNWDMNNSQYKMYGDIFVIISKDSIEANLGTYEKPGVLIADGKLIKLDISLTADFEIKKLTFKPIGLTFVWDEPNKRIQISGNVMVKIEKDSIAAVLGSPTSPGIKITNGIIDTIDVKVSGKFVLKSLAIKPDSLAFIYDRDSSQYKIFGRIEIDVDKDTIKAQLGTFKNPGIAIKEGKVNHINISVSSHFELKKLTIETDSLGIEWNKSSMGNVFHFFGKVKIDIDTNKIAFDFGTRTAPGLVFNNGKIESLKISTTNDIHFAGFEVATKDLTIEYSNQFYHMYGIILLKKMWSAEIDLGNGPGLGVTLDLSSKPAKLKIESAEFELENIDLGPITLKDLKLTLKQNKVQKAELKVDLPPGWEIDATMQFKYSNKALQIDAVHISWEALNFEQAIAIPGTGAFVTKLEGGLYGIEDPHEFKVTGDIGIAFGGPFKIPEVGEVSLLYLNANTSISRSEFIISANAYMGAYRKPDGTWTSVLGDGNITIDLLWGNSYSINGNLNIPSYPYTILKADLEAKLTYWGALNAHIGVHLIVPPKIPIVGGREFAEAEGLIHYDKADPLSFAAGWAKVNLGFFTWNGGVKYNFASKNFTTLGAKAITEVSNTTYSPPSSGSTGPGYLNEYIKINVDDSPNFVKVLLRFKKNSNRNIPFMIEVDNPLYVGNASLCPVYYVSGIDKITQKGMDITTIPTYKLQTFHNVDSLVFYIMAPGYKENQKATLPNAEYTVTVAHYSRIVMLDSYEVHKIVTPPFSTKIDFYVNNTSKTTGPLLNILSEANLNYHAETEVYNVDSTIVNLFYTKHQNDNGTLIKTVKYADYWGSHSSEEEYFKIEGIEFPADLSTGDSLFLYMTIDDKINAAYKSPVQYCSFNFPFQAKLNIAGMPDSLASGIETTLYIQNPMDKNWYAADSIKRFTDKKGLVSFPYSLGINTKVKFVFDIPIGYGVDPSSTYMNGEEVSVLGSTASNGKHVSILLRKKNSNGELYVR